MRRITWRVLMTLALAGAAQAMSFAATNTNMAAEEGAAAEMSALREDIDALRTQLHTGMTTSYDDPKPAPAAGGDDCDCNSGGCGECCQSCCNSGGTCGCFEPCCHSTGIWAVGEALWFKYHRADGVRVGTEGAGESAEFGFEITPRVTVGWVGEDGLGARVRYWKFDHSADSQDGPLSVDTWTLDFEVFDTFCLNRKWDLEVAAGIRYNEFREEMVDGPEFRSNDFTGWGIVASAELRRLVGCNGALFVRTRASILMSDKDIFNDDLAAQPAQDIRLKDVVVGQLELAFGYDYIVPYCDGSYAFARFQAEWQNWYNYSSSFVDTNANNRNERFGGPSDVGFGGFGVALGIMR